MTANTGAALWRAGSYTYDAMGNMLSSKLGDPELSFHVEEAYFTYVGTPPRISKVRRTALDDDFSDLSRPTRPSRIERQAVGYQTVTYDSAGNELTYIAARSYSPRNLLASVTDAAEVPTDLHRLEYAYDGRGVRVIRSETQANGTKPTRYFFYSPELQLLSTTADDAPNVYSLRLRTNAVPAVKFDFVWQGSRPLAELSSTFPTAIHWYFTDHLGTPLLQTDYNGQVVWRAEYEPYGDIWTMRVPAPDDEAPAPSYEQPLRFPGQESAMRWEGTEERYNIFRWYRAGWGRYTQPDPLVRSLESFGYVNGNPIGNIDPVGLSTVRFGPTVTHAVSWDEVYGDCGVGSGNLHGCAVLRQISWVCKRHCVDGRFYRSISLTSSAIDVYYATNSLTDGVLSGHIISGEEVLREEMKHVTDFNAAATALKDTFDALEEAGYADRGKCNRGCRAARDWTRNYLLDRIRRVDASHPSY